MSAIVEGSLRVLEDDASSSDSESDCGSVASQSKENTCDIEDEEELERFNDPVISINSKSVALESKIPILSCDEKPSVVSVADEFGVTYRKIPVKVQEETNLDDIHFDDFEFDEPVVITASQSMSQTIQHEQLAPACDDSDVIEVTIPGKPTVIDDNDDEFDICDSSLSGVDDIQKALQTIAMTGDTVSSSEEFVQSTDTKDDTSTSSFTAVYQPIDEPILSNSGTCKSDFRSEARKAFQDVVEAYGGGLGDNDIHQLTADKTASMTAGKSATAPIVVDKRVVGNTIEEGDEDAAEEEEEMEVKQAEAVKQHVVQLESEWEAVVPVNTAASSSVAKGDTIDNTSIKVSVTDVVSPIAYTKSSGVSTKYSYASSLKYLKSCDLQQFADSIVTTDGAAKQSMGKLFGLGGGGEINYSPTATTDLRFPFLVAQLDYDPACAEHLSMLTSIYNYFIPSDGATNSFGSFISSADSVKYVWEKLGFQGSDPRTDLNRSMKMLSILQMLHFIESDPQFVRTLHTMSESAEYSPVERVRGKVAAFDASWPFICVSIMFTKESIQALRSGALNDKCNRRKDVLSVVNDFHHSCFTEFHRLLTKEPLVHHAVHLATLRKTCVSNPRGLMKSYKQMREQSSATATSQSASAQSQSQSRSSKKKETARPGEELLTKFDNLESLTPDQQGQQQGGGDDTASSMSSWGNMFGKQSKASKFQVI